MGDGRNDGVKPFPHKLLDRGRNTELVDPLPEQLDFDGLVDIGVDPQREGFAEMLFLMEIGMDDDGGSRKLASDLSEHPEILGHYRGEVRQDEMEGDVLEEVHGLVFLGSHVTLAVFSRLEGPGEKVAHVAIRLQDKDILPVHFHHP
jgi:hypothetical protein